MKRTPIILFLLALPAWCLGQALDQAVPRLPAAPLNNLQGAWDGSSNAARADEWRVANDVAPGNAALQWNWFRSEYDALNSSSNGHLRPQDRVRLDEIAGLIEISAPRSFEHHLAAFYMQFPAASAFGELNAAAALAPERPELIAPMLSKAMVDGDVAALTKWSTALAERGALAPALMTVAQDVLLSVSADAILFANGDMDVQPLVVAQLRSNKNPGVLVVDRRLLDTPGYRTRVWTQAGAAGRVPTTGTDFARALLEATSRPVYFALSLDRSWLDAFTGQLHVVGAAFRVGGRSPQDAGNLARNWRAMQKPGDAGPLSRNYLLPGAVLLGQLQRTDDAAGAAAVEADLRRLATATGAVQELRTRGILEH